MAEAQGQPESAHDFRRDAIIVVKHARFIGLLFALALLVALLTGLISNADYTARAKVTVPPPSAGSLSADLVPKLSTYEKLATSDELVEAVAARLDAGQTAADLKARIHIRAVDAPQPTVADTVTIEAKGDSRADALLLGRTWTEEFVRMATKTTVDPDALAALGEMEGKAQERLEGIDPVVNTQLESASAELSATRERLGSAQGGIDEVEGALTFISDHPEASLPELQVAFALLITDLGNVSLGSVADLADALRFRRDYLGSLVPGIQSKIDDLADQEQELTVLNGQRTAAEATLQSVRQRIATAQVAAEALIVDAEPSGGISVSGGVNWLARIGAAAAFGLVVGVTGAFVLEYLGPILRSWSQRTGWARREGR